MKPVERIEKLIKKRRYKASAKTYDKALDSFLQAVDDHLKHKPAPSEPKIWRKIMKSRITTLAAAAVIVIAVYIVIHQSGGSIENVTFAQIRENMTAMPWLHAVAEVKQAEGTEMSNIRYEVWLCIERQLAAIKDSNGKVIFQDDLENNSQAYDPNTETITILQDKGLNWNKNLSSVGDIPGVIIKAFEEAGEKVVRETGKYKGKDVLVFKMSAFLNAMDQKIEMTVDTKSPVVLYIHQRAFDKAGKLTQETNVYFDYPETGPESIYDVGVSATTKIIHPEEVKEKTAFDKAFEEAIAVIDSRESWPEPRDLVIAYWTKRNAKKYDDLAIFWPGSATWNRRALENEIPVEYVFGEALTTETQGSLIVPYASKSYFDKHGTYSLRMRLRNNKSTKGRYYIVSGN